MSFNYKDASGQEVLEHVKSECVHCGNCTRNCSFLEKYSLDLAGYAEHSDLSYSCFLCDRCREVCPVDLSGRWISMSHRDASPEQFPLMQFMKRKYKMRNNSRAHSEDLLFLGCNFPGFFPETSKELIRIMADFGVDFSVDCCGKPLAEAADKKGAEIVRKHLIKIMEQKGTKRVVCTCPNCYHYFRELDDFPFEIVTVFQKLREFGIGEKLSQPIDIYFPCPERQNKRIFNDIEPFLSGYRDTFSEVNCCGAGGHAQKREPDVAAEWRSRVEKLRKTKLYTYCATCCGQFESNGVYETRHLISEVLGVHERPSINFFKNALTMKFYESGRRRLGRR